MLIIINIWWRQICWFLLPYWIQSAYNKVLLIFDISRPTSQLGLEVLHTCQETETGTLPMVKTCNPYTVQPHVPLPGVCETASFLRVHWNPALCSALEETAGVRNKIRWSMKRKVQKTYHSHSLHWFLTDVIDKAVCYKFRFVNAPFEVLQVLVVNALSHKKPCHFVNTNRHTLLASNFFYL